MKLSQAGLVFFEWCELNKNYSKKTVLNYEHHFRHFFDWIGDMELSKLDEDKILEYKKHLLNTKHAYQKDRTIKASTVGEKMKVLRTFLQCMEIKNIRAMSSTKIPAGVRADDRIIFFTQHEFKMIISTVDTGKPEGIRNRAILEMLFSTGMRLEELIQLNKDIDIEGGEVVVKGKFDKIRTVYLNSRAKYWIKKYLETRKDNYPALFTFVR